MAISPQAQAEAARLRSQMTTLGFGTAPDEVLHRLIMVLSGLEKKGKTHFAFTAPGPIAYFGFDVGEEGVIQKFVNQGKIIFPQRFKKPMTFGQDSMPSAAGALDEWLRFSRTWYKTLQIDGLRTVILDTESDAHELIRLARLGKLSQVKPHHYGPVNAEYVTLLKAAYDSDKNLILIDKMKKEYVNDKWNGKYERKGYNEIGFLAQVIMVMKRYKQEDLAEGESWPEDSFAAVITDCRQQPELNGVEYNNSFTCNFPFIATQILPETTLGDWQ